MRVSLIIASCFTGLMLGMHRSPRCEDLKKLSDLTPQKPLQMQQPARQITLPQRSAPIPIPKPGQFKQ